MFKVINPIIYLCYLKPIIRCKQLIIEIWNDNYGKNYKFILLAFALFASGYIHGREPQDSIRITKYENEFQNLLIKYNIEECNTFIENLLYKGQVKNDKELTVLAYKMKGNLLDLTGDLESSIEITKKAIKINNNINNKLYGDLNYNLSIRYSKLEDKDRSIYHNKIAENTYKKIKNYRGLCYLYYAKTNQALIENKLVEAEQAINKVFYYNNFYKSNFFEGLNYANLGRLFSILGNLNKGKEAFIKALQLFEKSENYHYYNITSANIISLNLLNDTNYEESRELINKSLNLIELNKINEVPIVANIYGMHVSLLLHEKKVESAERELKKLNKYTENYDSPLIKGLIKLCELELLSKKEKVDEFILKVKEIEMLKTTPEIQMQYLRITHNFLFENQNYKKGTKYLEKYWKLKDSINNSITLKNSVYNLEKFETEKKEKENLQLKADKAQQSILLAQESKRKWQLGAGLFTALIALAVFTFYYRRNKKQKEVIESLQKELHHRIKNNLSIIDTFIEVAKEEFEDPKFSKKLTELQNRIDSINEVHQQLYKNKDVTNLNLKNYIDTLAKNVESSFSNNKITIEKTVKDQLHLHADKSFPVGLIINEFLTNSYKYAFDSNEGKVKIEMNDLGSDYQLLLSDNGKGLPENFDLKTSDTFGLRIMKLLTEQLNGEFRLSNNNGVNLIINFPK